tara:strand:- start:1841 stop:2530 length:690 start_codon:yes stop_codon:yes gene_type:complete
MKNLSLTFFSLIITLVFSSCSQEESTFLEEPNSELFGKVILSRDASGSYTMDLETSNDVASNISSNEKSNSLDIDLYSASGTKQQIISEEMSTGSEDRFSINLNNTISNHTSRLTIFDKDISFLKNLSENDDDHLNSYSVSDNGDNTYDVNFTVNSYVEVDFTQDEETGEYMIHLEPGNGTQTEYSVTFNKEEGVNLNIAFLNYYPSESGKTTTSSTNSRPKVLIDGDS